MAVAFLAHLMRPISQMLSTPPSDQNSDEPPVAVSRDRTTMPQLALDLGRTNPWLGASVSSALDLAHHGSAQVSSLPVTSQLSTSLRGSSQALGAMCESFTQTAALLGISEKLVVERLKDLSNPPKTPKPHSAEYEELQKKLRKLSGHYELRLEEGLYRCRAAERKATELANSARVEIADLRRMLAEERRANSDLLLALEALRSSGSDTSALKTFLASKVPNIQRAAYLEAKVCLLRKIREKYPDADMKYFIDVKEIPGGADPPPEWLVVPEK